MFAEVIAVNFVAQLSVAYIFLKKGRVSLVLFQIKMVTTRLKNPLTSFSEI